MSQPIPIPGKGNVSRDTEINQLLQQLQDWYSSPVGHPDRELDHFEHVGSVLDRLAEAANPGAQHTSAEVTDAIAAARNLLGSRR